jgi:hypothetical protein
MTWRKLDVSMNRRALLGVLGLAGSGGCLRLTGAEATTSSTATGATSPATTRSTEGSTTETEATETTAAEPSLPSGLSEDGVSDYLFDFHLRELGQRSFATNWTLFNRREEFVKLRREYRVGDAGAVGSWTFDEGGPVSMFRSTDGGFWREDLGDEYTYGMDRDGYDMERLTLAQWVRPFVRGGVWSAPSLVRRESPARWEVQLTEVEDDAAVPGWFSGTVESLSGSMVVDERGFIRSLDCDMIATETAPGRVEYGVTYAVDSVDEVMVSEPAWLSTAKERRPRVSMALTDDRRYVRLTLESGNPIEPNTVINVHDEVETGRSLFYELREEIAAGETVYVYRGQDGYAKLSRGGRPTNASPVPLESQYHAWANRSGVEYFGTIDL